MNCMQSVWLASSIILHLFYIIKRVWDEITNERTSAREKKISWNKKHQQQQSVGPVQSCLHRHTANSKQRCERDVNIGWWIVYYTLSHRHTHTLAHDLPWITLSIIYNKGINWNMTVNSLLPAGLTFKSIYVIISIGVARLLLLFHLLCISYVIAVQSADITHNLVDWDAIPLRIFIHLYIACTTFGWMILVLRRNGKVLLATNETTNIRSIGESHSIILRARACVCMPEY